MDPLKVVVPLEVGDPLEVVDPLKVGAPLEVGDPLEFADPLEVAKDASGTTFGPSEQAIALIPTTTRDNVENRLLVRCDHSMVAIM